MKIKSTIHDFNTILLNGPLNTRLKFEHGIQSILEVFDKPETKKALHNLYEGDVATAKENKLPIIINAATYRASRNHLSFIKNTSNTDIQNINQACLDIIINIRSQYRKTGHTIFIGAPLGSMHNAYNTTITPTIDEAMLYHSEQIEAFNGMNVDFINVVTIPSLAEAIGISLAAEKSGMDYTIGFILNNHGHLLDGTPVNDAIQQINKATIKKPLGYSITCTHTQLDKITIPTTDSPKKFASDVVKLKKLLGLKIVGGCCGTTNLHLKRISEAMRKLY